MLSAATVFGVVFSHSYAFMLIPQTNKTELKSSLHSLSLPKEEEDIIKELLFAFIFITAALHIYVSSSEFLAKTVDNKMKSNESGRNCVASGAESYQHDHEFQSLFANALGGVASEYME